MKFQKNTRRRALEYEKDLVQYWKQNKTFEKSIEQRSKDNAFVFYDGPPFISGVPHHGTLLSSIVKDAVPRYQTMKGKRVERVWGWDCHGLPAERFTEKKLGIHSRQEVIEYGIEKYINATRENMVQTSGLWEEYVDRIGRWVDFKGAYRTMDKDYMESIWWAFKTLYEKGKIYEGEKVLMYCTLDGTPLSKAEVTMDAGAYQDVTDPSVYIKFKLQDGRYLLAWTTTPWTLPANTAVAVKVAHELCPLFPDGQLHVDLRGYAEAPALTPTEVLARFLIALGATATQLPSCKEQLVSLYRTMLRGRRILVVLDNAITPGQVRPLLPSAPGCGVIITSRNANWRGTAGSFRLKALPELKKRARRCAGVHGHCCGQRCTAPVRRGAAGAGNRQVPDPRPERRVLHQLRQLLPLDQDAEQEL